MTTTSILNVEGLLKHNLANLLRTEITNGALKPNERIVEGKWSRKFSVAQGSIREAINILALEGFVTKVSGRSARVVHFSEQDVLQLVSGSRCNRGPGRSSDGLGALRRSRPFKLP